MKMKGRRSLFLALTALTGLLFGASESRAADGKIQLGVGYSYLRIDESSLHGGRLSPEYRLNGFASVVGDFSFDKGKISSSSTTVTTYLGGIRVKRGIGSLGLYAHALAGGVRTSSSISPVRGVSISVNDNDLGFDGGGGLEFKVRSFRTRLGADYLTRRVDTGGGTRNVNDIRATLGVVF